MPDRRVKTPCYGIETVFRRIRKVSVVEKGAVSVPVTLKWLPQVYRFTPFIVIMPFTQLQKTDYASLIGTLSENSWIVACFCAHWCGACRSWRPAFEKLAAKYPDIVFLWIDIEDHAELLDDLDVENFPSLLIQYGDIVNFFGCVHPDAHLAERLLKSQLETALPEMKRLASSNEEHACWQKDVNLRTLLYRAVGNVA